MIKKSSDMLIFSLYKHTNLKHNHHPKVSLHLHTSHFIQTFLNTKNNFLMAIEKENGTAQSGERLATVLAIGTANPENVLYQADFPDYYFQTTQSEDLVDLKLKFKRICKYIFLKI